MASVRDDITLSFSRPLQLLSATNSPVLDRVHIDSLNKSYRALLSDMPLVFTDRAVTASAKKPGMINRFVNRVRWTVYEKVIVEYLTLQFPRGRELNTSIASIRALGAVDAARFPFAQDRTLIDLSRVLSVLEKMKTQFSLLPFRANIARRHEVGFEDYMDIYNLLQFLKSLRTLPPDRDVLFAVRERCPCYSRQTGTMEEIQACVIDHDAYGKWGSSVDPYFLRFPRVYNALREVYASLQDTCDNHQHDGTLESTFVACFDSLNLRADITEAGIVGIKQSIHEARLSRLSYWFDQTGNVQSVQPVSIVTALLDHTQGESGFVEEVRSSILQAIEHEATACSSRALKKHQREVKAIMQPNGPVQRLLVHHRVGSGKTRTAIEILDNFFDDPRTKIVICPSEALCQQFYLDLLKKSDNRYRKWIEAAGHTTLSNQIDVLRQLSHRHLNGKAPALFDGMSHKDGWFSFTRNTNDDATFLAGPLLVLPIYRVEYMLDYLKDLGDRTVGIAGGVQFQHGMVDGNPLSNKIIVFDEFHTLFTPEIRSRQYEDKRWGTDTVDYHLLKTMLQTTTGSIVAALTATLPGQEHDQEMVAILTQGMGSSLDGYLHAYDGDTVLFPLKDDVGSLLVPVPIDTSTQLQFEVCGKDTWSEFKVRVYKKEDKHYRNTTCRAPYDSKILTSLIANLAMYAPKMAMMKMELINHVTSGQNAIILCDEPSGIDLLEAVLQRDLKYSYIRVSPSRTTGYNANTKVHRSFKKYTDAITFWEEECMKEIHEKPTQVVIVDTEELAEGLNLLGVTLMLGLSDYPDSQKMEQAFGRGDRMCTRNMYRKNVTSESVLRRIQYVETIDQIASDQSVHAMWTAVDERNQRVAQMSF